MLRKFVAATFVPCVVIPIATLILLLAPIRLERTYLLPLMWCFAPLAWGIWAIVAPGSWFPHRLPLWGAILGLAAGSVASFGLDIPSRILGAAVPTFARAVVVLLIMVFYYLLWMLVRKVYGSLATLPKT